MPQIIPIKDLKKTSEISQMCHETSEPIYITKNGYGDMVIMSLQMYEEKLFLQDVYNKLDAAESEVLSGKTFDADESLKSVRRQFGV